jgi:adhesin/invasin
VTGTTGADGIATATLTNTTAGVSVVTATLSNNANQTVDTTFVADGSTAVINDADFTVGTGALANNTATNALSATVKDAGGNPLEGQTVTFAVTVGSAVLSSATATTDANGVATATLKSTVAETNQVTASVRGTATTAKPSEFVAPPAFTGITVNGHDFAIADGFPTTGFTGAEFSLTVNGAASDYTWSSSAPSWALVDNSGKVSFTSQGNTSPVTITATPTGGGAALTYIFTVGSWFTNNGSTFMTWESASAWCLNNSLLQPTQANLTNGQDIRNVGSLWSEWGNMANYSGSGFTGDTYWTSDPNSDLLHYVVVLFNGSMFNNFNTVNYGVVCRQVL